MKVEQMSMSVNGLVHADWNPRFEAELKAENKEMAELTETIRNVGVLQPIAVWINDDKKIVIAGNRRFEAAKIAGLSEVPCIVFTEVDEAFARNVTRTENEVRIGINPIKDAEQIKGMMDKGMSQKEISAHYNVSEASICRRVKLIDLIPEIKDAAIGGGIMTNALEMMALYPAEIQKSCFLNFRHRIGSDKKVHWEDVSWDFQRHTKDLDSVEFDTEDCISCFDRTGAQADLWGNVEKNKKGKCKLGCCMNCKCYEKHMKAYIESEVRKIVPERFTIVSFDDIPISYYESGNDDWDSFFGDSPSKKFSVAYYNWSSYESKASVKYGVPAIEIVDEYERRSLREAEEDAERQAEFENNRAKRAAFEVLHAQYEKSRTPYSDAFEKAYDVVSSKLNSINKESSVGAILKGLFNGKKKMYMFAYAISVSMDDWHLNDEFKDAAIKFCEDVPSLAKLAGVTKAEIAEARKAYDALVKFEVENPEPKLV